LHPFGLIRLVVWQVCLDDSVGGVERVRAAHSLQHLDGRLLGLRPRQHQLELEQQVPTVVAYSFLSHTLMLMMMMMMVVVVVVVVVVLWCSLSPVQDNPDVDIGIANGLRLALNTDQTGTHRRRPFG
jgi:hypothetical protein